MNLTAEVHALLCNEMELVEHERPEDAPLVYLE
jgi:hypothetical protein